MGLPSAGYGATIREGATWSGAWLVAGPPCAVGGRGCPASGVSSLRGREGGRKGGEQVRTRWFEAVRRLMRTKDWSLLLRFTQCCFGQQYGDRTGGDNALDRRSVAKREVWEAHLDKDLMTANSRCIPGPEGARGCIPNDQCDDRSEGCAAASSRCPSAADSKRRIRSRQASPVCTPTDFAKSTPHVFSGTGLGQAMHKNHCSGAFAALFMWASWLPPADYSLSKRRGLGGGGCPWTGPGGPPSGTTGRRWRQVRAVVSICRSGRYALGRRRGSAPGFHLCQRAISLGLVHNVVPMFSGLLLHEGQHLLRCHGSSGVNVIIHLQAKGDGPQKGRWAQWHKAWARLCWN